MVAGRGRDDELSEEIETHLALLASEYRRQGLSDDEARLAARRSFGGVDQVRQEYREQRRLPSIDAFLQDVRYGARLLLRDRASTLAAIGLLTLGVGSTVVMADMLLTGCSSGRRHTSTRQSGCEGCMTRPRVVGPRR